MATGRIPALDGWRGISILFVLAAHMLPLGPKFLDLNGTIAAAGMCIFFFLSGFLIVSMLNRGDGVLSFLVRRAFRIVPLAWSVLVVFLVVSGANSETWKASLLFYANLPPFYLSPLDGHFWSLCVEVQFYAAIAAVVALLGRRGIILVPVACLFITALRVLNGVQVSIVTWYRLDEILVGGAVALAMNESWFQAFIQRVPRLATLPLMALLIACSHEHLGMLNYARPYVAGLLIISTLGKRPDDIIQSVLCSRFLGYLAEISYALYIIHPFTMAGWFGDGDRLVRYSKRPLSFLLTLLFAHVSTRYFERRCIGLGHRIANRLSATISPESSWKVSDDSSVPRVS